MVFTSVPKRVSAKASAAVTVNSSVSCGKITIAELTDIRTAVSEAVTNAIIHGYGNDPARLVYMACSISGRAVELTVRDEGRGIEDVELARQPFYTSCPELERSGMGFTVMEAFMEEVEVLSAPGEGTTVRMKKRVRAAKASEAV